jgi:hypothetical protein
MQTQIGVFKSRRLAEEAVRALQSIGLGNDQIIFITPEHWKEGLDSVPAADAEAPGIGEVISGYAGGVIGGSVGLGLGSGVASLFVPGVGTVFAAGLGAAVLLGVSGAAVGSKIGEVAEQAQEPGVPRDDVLFLRELLKSGRTLVVAVLSGDKPAAAVHAVLQNFGAEDVNTARKEWETRHSDAA